MAPPRLPQAVDRRDDQRLRLAVHGAGAAARRRAVARRERVRCVGAVRRRVPALHSLRDPRGRLGRPAAAQADPRHRRHWPCGAARLDPARVPLRRAHARTAVRGRLPRRHLHGLLRRRLPVVLAVARRARAARRRQFQARDQPFDLAAGRAGHGGRPDRHLRSAVRDVPRRGQLRGLGRLPLRDPPAREAAGAELHRRAAEHARRRTGGPEVRPREPLPARDLDLHRDVELLLQHERGADCRLRRARARHVPGGSRSRVLARQHRPSGCRVHDEPDLEQARRRARRSCGQRSSSRVPRSSCRWRRSRPPSHSSSRSA